MCFQHEHVLVGLWAGEQIAEGLHCRPVSVETVAQALQRICIRLCAALRGAAGVAGQEVGVALLLLLQHRCFAHTQL